MDGCLVQHGPENERIYLMRVDGDMSNGSIVKLVAEAEKRQYTKITAKIPKRLEAAFAAAGFVREAVIPGFFLGEEEAVFMSLFLSKQRSRLGENEGLIHDVLRKAEERESGARPQLAKGFTWKVADAVMAPEIAELYGKIFETYPFPIHDPSYIQRTMADGSVVYYAALSSPGSIAALASSELDRQALGVEMTDFATDTGVRGNGLAAFLLAQMERDMAEEGYRTAYTIARAVSYGMNLTFAGLGYAYGGTLVNNTNIGGQLESMNVWYKPLRPQS